MASNHTVALTSDEILVLIYALSDAQRVPLDVCSSMQVCRERGLKWQCITDKLLHAVGDPAEIEGDE